ncbi:MAG: methyl-accepting chemotaxis protein [Bacillota bacterium]
MITVRKSIRMKLIMINIITLVIALLLSAVLSYNKAKVTLKMNMEQTLTSLAVTTSQEVGLWLDARKSEVSTLANTAVLNSSNKKAKLSYLAGEIKRNNIYETFFIADAQGDYVITSGNPGNVKDREYFQKVMATGQTFVSDPVVSRATGKKVVVVASPIKKSNKTVGLLGGTVTTDDLSRLVASIKAGQTGYAYMVQGDGLVIAHPDKDLVMKLNIFNDTSLDPRLKEAMQSATSGHTDLSRYIFQGEDKYVAYTSVPGTDWGIGVTVPVKEILVQLRFLPYYAFWVALILALISALMAHLLLTGVISRPIQNMQKLMAKAEQGDLTIQGQVLSQDEIGQLTTSFNHLIGKLQQMFVGFRENAMTISNSLEGMSEIAVTMAINNKEMDKKISSANDSVSHITESILGTANIAREATDHIIINASALEEMFNSIQKLASASEEISASVEQVSTGVENNYVSIDNISKSAMDMSDSVNSVVTAVKEINLSLNDVDRNCERSIQITDDAVKRAGETREIITKLNDSSKQISKIVNVINDIAEQTKMLALNAAIEAAGAGEAGRGFAVVANEVKELAKQTAEATDEISQRIEAMQINMSEAVRAVETITQVIGETTVITSTIAAAVTQQSAATGDISQSAGLAAEKASLITKDITDVAENARQTAQNIEEASKGLQDIARSINELSLSANDATENTTKASEKVALVSEEASEISKAAVVIAKSIQEISLASAETATGAGNTSNSANTLAEMARKMENLVQQFQV